ncbi:M15 family metallopeptidase [Nocardioides sp.]|uniref:M15 family metallopeptidase n=1 Tax=Nocardioides sp. TaxID=35761 RepID=UPI002736BE4C|nr:M15 family metallopeptidase [Nocardioides sp.]MDP3890479.1 M15 family metallopeptidase [Nocardioides sp.]
MTVDRQRWSRVRPVVVLALIAALITACAGTGATDAESDGTPAPGTPTATAQPGQVGDSTPPADPDHSVEPPGPVQLPLLPADILIYSQEPLSPDMVKRIGKLPGIAEAEQLSMAQVAVQDYTLVVAAVEPASYRRFTPSVSAQLQEAWDRVAGGEVAVDPKLGKRLQEEGGHLRLGNGEQDPVVHIGAYAPQVPRIDAVVNAKWGETLGMRTGNAMLISTGMASPQSIRKPLQRIAGDQASVQILGPDLDLDVAQTAFLTGGSVAQAVGSFSYQVLGGGRIQPDAAWEAANIRTEQVPILGNVRCHKVMLPQLRAALNEVQVRGLADKINPNEYAGCYYPRFIANSTNLSLHSWGIALDMNVPGNQRGTVGEMDRQVVAIFKKWGFAWGGDWSWTDPMHFELARLVDAR